MKVTNEQLKQIIKEELRAVMNESSSLLALAAVLALKKKREREAAARRAAQQPHPRGGYKRGYGMPSNSSETSSSEIQKRLQQQQAKADAEARAKEEEQQRYLRNMDPSLEALGQAKMNAILTLGVDEDGDLPRVYAWGNTGDEDWLGTYYDGPLSFGEAMELAISTDNISRSDIDDESGGFHIDNLFPGKYLPSQLPIFDKDADDFYSNKNYQALVAGGYMDDDYSYGFTDKGEKMRKLLGF